VAKTRNTVLAPKADEILATARPAIAFKSAKAAEKSLAVGASKLGGRPDMPEKQKWPKYQDSPLSFLGQFNLAELRPSPVARDLPDAGVISIFADTQDEDGDFSKGTWRLLYFPDPSALVRRDAGEDLDSGDEFPSCRVEYAETLTLPEIDSRAAENLDLEDSHLADEVYCDLLSDLAPGDHLLGHAIAIQEEVVRRKGERHLLSLYGNDATGWQWGDAGALYFVINEDHLKVGKFDRVKMEMQCH
jgi:uncharacterized protein YwqG